MSVFKLKEYLDAHQHLMEQSLKDHLKESTPSTPGRVVQAMEYSLMAGGKRLRPILCLAACQAVNGDTTKALRAASALEMIHTYSLIHDDLPAMDNDDLRRGHPTCHKAFDEATAVLAGDALLTAAFHLLAIDGTTSPSVALEVVRITATASGALGMVEGQMRDIEAEGCSLGIDALKRLHALKTGALICASVEIGAVLGGATAEERRALRYYADKLGLAFQVADDILNVEGDPLLMGKGVGTDAKLNKATYPSLLGLSESKAYAATLVDEAVGALAPFNERAKPLEALAYYSIQRRS